MNPDFSPNTQDASSNRLFRVVRQNAIPAAMIGLGMVLLFRSREDVDSGEDAATLHGVTTDIEDAPRLDAAKQKLRDAAAETRGIVAERPLVAGIAAMAFGALVGALIPETDREHELLGQRRDMLVGRARDAMRDGVEKARDLATQAATAATDAARKSVTTAARRMDVGKNLGVADTTE